MTKLIGGYPEGFFDQPTTDEEWEEFYNIMCPDDVEADKGMEEIDNNCR